MLQLDPGKAHRLRRRLRRVTTRLGAVRELDVLLLLVDEVHVARRSGNSALGRVGISVAKDRDDARKRMSARLPIAGLRRLAQKLERVGEQLRPAEASSSRAAARKWRLAVDAQVAGRASRLSAALADAGAIYLPERLHAVRIAVKKLRYGLELATELAGGKNGAGLKALKRGQDVLGRMHDLQVLIERLRQTQASLTPPSLTVWRDLDEIVVSLEDECRRLHARYMRSRDQLAAIAESLGAPPQGGVAPRARRAG